MKTAFAFAALALLCCCANAQTTAPAPSPYTSANGMGMMTPFTYDYSLPCSMMNSSSSSSSSPSSSMMMWRDAIINNDIYAAAMEAWMMWYRMNGGSKTMCTMASPDMMMNVSMMEGCMMTDGAGMNFAMNMNCTVSCMSMGQDGKYYMVNEWVTLAAVCYQPPAYMMNVAYPPMDTVNMTMMTGYGSMMMPYSGSPMMMMPPVAGRKLKM